MTSSAIRIATRASRLALWQASHVADLLARCAGSETEIVEISTHGDRSRHMPLETIGGEGVFTREVQSAVLDGRADIAVHSLKDLPTTQTAGLVLAAVPVRGADSDALILPADAKRPADRAATEVLAQLACGARIGTGSPRRRAQLLHQRSDLVMLDVRGNVETRLEKLDRCQYDALVLAEAGLVRLGLQDRIAAFLTPPLMYPAVGQGALGIECRADDARVAEALSHINDSISHAAADAERTVLRVLRAGCHAPLGTRTRAIQNGGLSLEAVVLSLDGGRRLLAAAAGHVAAAEELGRRVADDLLRQGAGALLQQA